MNLQTQATRTGGSNDAPFPFHGYLRVDQIVGSKRKGIPPLIPVSRSTWWAGCLSGAYPKPIKLSPGVTVWRAEDIRSLIERTAQAAANE
jgi:predicted DNA-binding transcriptional regulator AlpA